MASLSTDTVPSIRRPFWLTAIAFFHFMVASLCLVLVTLPLDNLFWPLGCITALLLFTAAGIGLLRRANWARIMAIGLQFVLAPCWLALTLAVSYLLFIHFQPAELIPGWLLWESLVLSIVLWALVHGRMVSYLTSAEICPLFVHTCPDAEPAMSPTDDVPDIESAYTEASEKLS